MAALNWVNSTPSSRQRPLAKTVIYVRVKATPALPWTQLNEVASPGATLALTDQQPGDWEFGLDEVDVDGRVSTKRLVVAGTVAFEPPSGAVSGSFTP